MLDEKKTVDVNDIYGLRLIEQGKAVIEDRIMQKTVTPSEQKEEKKAAKNGKG